MKLDTDRDYSVLNLKARLEHHTDSSAMFQLGQIENALELHGRKLRIPVFNVVGWLDIHYPCSGFHKLVIRSLYHEAEDSLAAMHGIVRAVKNWLEIDDSVSYHVLLIAGDKHHSMQDPTDGIPSSMNRDSFDVPEGFWDEWDARRQDRNGNAE